MDRAAISTAVQDAVKAYHISGWQEKIVDDLRQRLDTPTVALIQELAKTELGAIVLLDALTEPETKAADGRDATLRTATVEAEEKRKAAEEEARVKTLEDEEAAKAANEPLPEVPDADKADDVPTDFEPEPREPIVPVGSGMKGTKP